ncbi:hypothetical protein PIB30_092715 [Stylosanthes scabra]|uniref:Uncharacterized protein n=1 Tax=Stylosanthes scabra TaxID=79078 RepID=A0ABU6TXT6_9FABA|nr:hypothetical protein [Stylosanthes scabra]
MASVKEASKGDHPGQQTREHHRPPCTSPTCMSTPPSRHRKQEILVLLKQGQNPNSVSPVVGSNLAQGAKEARPGLVTRSSKRANRTKISEGSDNPDYLPIEMPPTSPEDWTFLFKRSNTKTTRTNSLGASTVATRKRPLFSTNQKPMILAYLSWF